MIIKYLSFLLGIIWSYSIIKTQSIFSNKTAILFKVFISKVSWFTFLAACYFGFKNFSIKAWIIGIMISIGIVHLVFFVLGNYFVNKLGNERLLKIKMIFEFKLGLSPKFDINLNVLKKITHYQIEPDKKMIEEQLDYLRNQYGKLVTREKVQNKYEIIAEFKNENIDINKIGNFKLEEVKSKKAINELKAAGVGKIFQIKIRGLFKESTTMKRITNFDDNKLEEISANEITIEIKEINERVPALLNQELFDKLYEKGSVKTEKDLKGKIKIGLENQFKPQSNQKLINDISETIVEKTKFKLPEDFLKNWIQNSGKEPLTEKEAVEEFKRSEKGIRYQLIEGKIIKENNLNYTFEELQNYAKKIVESQMRQYGQSIDKKQVDALVSKVLTNQEETKRISDQLIGEKMIKFYLEKAPLKKKKVGFDVFIKEAYGKA